MKASPDPGARARALPKVLLHEHLDGGLRVATLLDLLYQMTVRKWVFNLAANVTGASSTSARTRGSGSTSTSSRCWLTIWCA